jgi:type II secretory pathway component PulF
MAVFKYTARDAEGKQMTGTVNAADQTGAVEKISAQGLYPVKVSAEGGGDSSSSMKSAVVISDEIPRHKGRAKPNLRDLANYTRQLANLLKAGMPITASLSSMINLESGGIPPAVSEDLLHEVREGRNLSSAMASHPDIFPDMYINMVKAGESGGSLVEVLLRLAEHYERFAEVRQKVVSALVYPAFVIGLGFILIFVFMSYILPKFMKIFEGQKIALPLSTQILQQMSDFFSTWWWLVLIIGFLFSLVMKIYFSSAAGRERLHAWMLEAPLVKKIVRPTMFGQFTRTLGALLRNGVPVLTALKITESVVQNVVLQEAIALTREGVTDGKTLAQPLARSGVFPKLIVDLVHIGEQTGDVPAALENLAETYDNELTVNLRVITTLIEPILIVFIAGAVGFMLVGVLQAMFKITSAIGQ